MNFNLSTLKEKIDTYKEKEKENKENKDKKKPEEKEADLVALKVTLCADFSTLFATGHFEIIKTPDVVAVASNDVSYIN